MPLKTKEESFFLQNCNFFLYSDEESDWADATAEYLQWDVNSKSGPSILSSLNIVIPLILSHFVCCLFLELIINFSWWILVLYSHDREQKYLMYESESQEA